MPKNVENLDKIIVAKGFKKLPKVQKSPNLVTLALSHCLHHSTDNVKQVNRLEGPQRRILNATR